MSDHTFRFALRATASILLIVGQVALSPPANAAAGDLDPTFGTGGSVTTDVGGYDEVFALMIQPDGRIVAAGETWDPQANASDIVVARYVANGRLDPTFGSRGAVVTDLGGSREYAASVALQPDGKIVVAGSSDDDFAVVRYGGDGSLDPAFGVGGVMITDFGGGSDHAGAVVVQADGKIVAGGYANADATGSTSTTDFALARYRSDGVLDPTFGNGGLVTTNIDDGQAGAESLVLQPDGKLVLGGTGLEGIALARYGSDGSLDPTFGTAGIAENVVLGVSLEGLARQPDGRLVAVGRSWTETAIALERFDLDGGLDPSFGTGGQVITNIASEDYAVDVEIQPDGKIVAGGNSFGNAISRRALVRYRPDGSLDPEFGGGGIALTTALGNLLDMALQPDGQIVAGGMGRGVDGDMALARFQGSAQTVVAPSISSFSPTSGPVGTWVTIVGSGLNGATSVRFGDTYQPSFTADPSGTSIVATVPTGATSGAITVTTPSGTVVSASNFSVTSAPNAHVRNVTLRLTKHLRTGGRIVIYDGFEACVQGRNVRIQRSFEGDWRTIAHAVTDLDGRYRRLLPDRAGWYRAVIRQVTLPTGDTCNAAISGARHHEARSRR